MKIHPQGIQLTVVTERVSGRQARPWTTSSNSLTNVILCRNNLAKQIRQNYIFFLKFQDNLPIEDHHRAVAALIRKPPSDWKRPPGRHNHMRLRTIGSDLTQETLYIGSFIVTFIDL